RAGLRADVPGNRLLADSVCGSHWMSCSRVHGHHERGGKELFSQHRPVELDVLENGRARLRVLVPLHFWRNDRARAGVRPRRAPRVPHSVFLNGTGQSSASLGGILAGTDVGGPHSPDLDGSLRRPRRRIAGGAVETNDRGIAWPPLRRISRAAGIGGAKG